MKENKVIVGDKFSKLIDKSLGCYLRDLIVDGYDKTVCLFVNSNIVALGSPKQLLKNPSDRMLRLLPRNIDRADKLQVVQKSSIYIHM